MTEIVQQKPDMKTYRREYYRKLYHTNIEYKEKKKEYNKKFYTIKTIRCVECFRRNNLQSLKDMDFTYDEKNFICPNCLPENKVEQIKSKRGRPKKIILSNVIDE